MMLGHDHRLDWDKDLECDACHQRCRNGRYCRTCEFTVHMKCVSVINILETSEHPSHDGHRLKLLTTGAPDRTDPKCHKCGKETKLLLYHSSVDNISLHIGCVVEAMCSQANLDMPWHHHPLLMLNVGDHRLCVVCGLSGAYGYCCPRCWFVVHEKCASVFDPPEITHPCHTRHSLKLLTGGAPSYTDPECHVCGRHTGDFLYHCDTCKFNMDMVCGSRRPPPVALSNLKVHHHTLTLLPRLISFVCDACGTKGDRSPYVCFQCDLMFFHQDCASLPRVIHVNRHDHRVSYTYPLGRGEWKCGVCWEEIDWSYGAYSCLLCPNYALHSRCAIIRHVWDGKELDGVPEEVEDITPFKMIDDHTITHFAHEHNLSVNKDGNALTENILCGMCVRPVDSKIFYNCSDCAFVLHQTCANLPKKKRHFLSPRLLTLRPNTYKDETTCRACLQLCCKGFVYTDGDNTFDLLCSSITLPFTHESHPHHLLYHVKSNYGDGMMMICHGCNGAVAGGVALGCIKCNYFLDFRCATLPLTVQLLRYDDHPLTLCYREKASGKYWCDVCERELNPETWFYTCNDCGVTLHVFCVLGSIRYPRSGEKIDDSVELRFNSTSSRPICSTCQYHCPAPFFLMKENDLFCSYYCLLRIRMGNSSISVIVLRPPWVSHLLHDGSEIKVRKKLTNDPINSRVTNDPTSDWSQFTHQQADGHKGE